MEFIDLKAQYRALQPAIDAGIRKVLEGTRFIGGDEVKELETRLAAFVGRKHCISCANGTDALSLAAMAWGIGEGDAVFVPDFTYFASGEIVSFEGAAPIFVDVCKDTYNIDPDKLEKAIIKAKNEGKYKLKAVVAVDLFGQPADFDKIRAICDKYDLLLLEDGAQGFGGRYKGKTACSFGDISTTSFFPAKPLGCYGDGGAVFTDNDEWADLIRSYAVHGKGSSKYDNVRVGVNSRLDTIQAALLSVKFDAFKNYELEDINKVAAKYTELFTAAGAQDKGLVLPIIEDGFYSSWAQYTVQLPEGAFRDKIQSEMKALGIPTMIYYIKPMHCQGAFEGTDSAVADCEVTEQICGRVLSLPLDPYKSDDDVKLVVDSLIKLI